MSWIGVRKYTVHPVSKDSVGAGEEQYSRGHGEISQWEI